MSAHRWLVETHQPGDRAMHTTLGAIELKQTTTSTLAVVLRACRRVFQQWRHRRKLIAELNQLDRRELADLGISRGEIGFVASHLPIEQRGILSGSRD
jgi:uncharacterized protein YjiS (DUF1127 family)